MKALTKGLTLQPCRDALLTYEGYYRDLPQAYPGPLSEYYPNVLYPSMFLRKTDGIFYGRKYPLMYQPSPQIRPLRGLSCAGSTSSSSSPHASTTGLGPQAQAPTSHSGRPRRPGSTSFSSSQAIQPHASTTPSSRSVRPYRGGPSSPQYVSRNPGMRHAAYRAGMQSDRQSWTSLPESVAGTPLYPHAQLPRYRRDH